MGQAIRVDFKTGRITGPHALPSGQASSRYFGAAAVRKYGFSVLKPGNFCFA
jgi:hypothetical protein